MTNFDLHDFEQTETYNDQIESTNYVLARLSKIKNMPCDTIDDCIRVYEEYRNINVFAMQHERIDLHYLISREMYIFLLKEDVVSYMNNAQYQIENCVSMCEIICYNALCDANAIRTQYLAVPEQFCMEYAWGTPCILTVLAERVVKCYKNIAIFLNSKIVMSSILAPKRQRPDKRPHSTRTPENPETGPNLTKSQRILDLSEVLVFSAQE